LSFAPDHIDSEEREGHVVTHEFETRVALQMFDIPFCASEKIVHTQNIMALRNQTVDQMRSDESRTAGNEYALTTVIKSCHRRRFPHFELSRLLDQKR
jgi:hypothetical protein